MIKERDRDHIFNLLKEYREETGREATAGGDITNDFLIWRKTKEQKKE